MSARQMSQSLSALSLTSFATPMNPVRFEALPPEEDKSGIVLLDPHIPFPTHSSAADDIVAALAAFRASDAFPVWEMLENTNNRNHDPRYYIREKSRRLHMYQLLTAIIRKMVSLSLIYIIRRSEEH